MLMESVVAVMEVVLLRKIEKKHRWIGVGNYLGIAVLLAGVVLTFIYY
jgi:hypothetical protein